MRAAPHPETIKAQLRMKHGTLLAFEVAKGLPKNSTKDVLRGRSVARTEQAIADELGKPLHILFPRHARKRGESTKVDSNDAAAAPHRLIARSG